MNLNYDTGVPQVTKGALVPQRTKRKLISVSLAFVWLLLFVSTAQAGVEPGDPGVGSDTWYYDLQGHWARTYVLTLWREGVTNGYPFVIFDPDSFWTYGYNFEPDTAMKRGQLLYMMSKLFGFEPQHILPPPWEDLPPGFSLYGKPAYGTVAAAAYEWFPDRSQLHPYDQVCRLSTTDFIMSALRLDDYPTTLSSAQVDGLLQQFSDHNLIPTSYRPLVASAVRLGLLIGYEDSTLRMDNTLTRAEASAILYRSCLMRVVPEYTHVSASGTPYPDSLPIDVIGLRNQNNKLWQVIISDMQGNPIAHIPSGGAQSGDPHPVSWDLHDSLGDEVQSGEYMVGGYLQDRHSQVFEAIPAPVWVVDYNLDAWITPSKVESGATATVMAHTQGGAHSVWVTLPDGSKVPATHRGTSGDTAEWSLDVQAAPQSGFTAGTSQLQVRAEFERAEKHQTLNLQVTKNEEGEPIGKSELMTILSR